MKRYLFLLIVTCVATSWFVVQGSAAEDTPVMRLEAPGDPPGEPATETRFPAAVWTRDRFSSIQVNITAAGADIIGDAANEPSLAIDPTNPDIIVIGWRQFDTINSDFRQAGVSHSQDSGVSWTFPGVLDPGQFRSDPVLDADADGNIFYYSLSTLSSIELFKSVDGGVSWSNPVFGFGGDKAWMAIDRTGGFGHGNIYAKWQTFFGCCGDATFTRSTDGGASFMSPVTVPLGPSFGTVAVGPDGAVYVAGIEAVAFQNFNSIVVSKSTNAQFPVATPTFSPAIQVDLGGALAIGGGPNPAGLLGQVWVAVDHSNGPTRGNVYMLASVDPPGGDPLDVMFSRSTDGGTTWSQPVRINDDPVGNGRWQWFGTLSIAPNGRIDVLWNDTRNSVSSRISELFYASSEDGGLTWSNNIPVSLPFDSWLGWPQQNKLGDYYDMISDDAGASVAYAATFNGGQDVFYLRIGVDCDKNNIADEDEIADGTAPDCNGNGILDDCEPDCQPNGIPDDCDVDPADPDGNGQVSLDTNANDIPDECEPETPVVPPSPHDRAKNRYISFSPNNPGEQVRLKVTLTASIPHPALVGSSWWVQAPVVTVLGTVPIPLLGPGECVALLGPQATAAEIDWDTAGCQTLHVTGCPIEPTSEYEIQAVAGAFPSAVLTVATALRPGDGRWWGDTVGIFDGVEWTPPNGTTNIDDASVGIKTFQGGQVVPPGPIPPGNVAHLSVPDVDPGNINMVVNINDVLFVILAFQGGTYPFGPADADGNCP